MPAVCRASKEWMHFLLELYNVVHYSFQTQTHTPLCTKPSRHLEAVSAHSWSQDRNLQKAWLNMVSPDLADLIVFLEPVHLLACSVWQCYNCAFFIEIRWPDGVFKASKAPQLLTMLFHLSCYVPAVEVLYFVSTFL